MENPAKESAANWIIKVAAGVALTVAGEALFASSLDYGLDWVGEVPYFGKLGFIDGDLVPELPVKGPIGAGVAYFAGVGALLSGFVYFQLIGRKIENLRSK